MVDERGKDYTIYGDEAVSPEITEYIRGDFWKVKFGNNDAHQVALRTAFAKSWTTAFEKAFSMRILHIIHGHSSVNLLISI